LGPDSPGREAIELPNVVEFETKTEEAYMGSRTSRNLSC